MMLIVSIIVLGFLIGKYIISTAFVIWSNMNCVKYLKNIGVYTDEYNNEL